MLHEIVATLDQRNDIPWNTDRSMQRIAPEHVELNVVACPLPHATHAPDDLPPPE